MTDTATESARPAAPPQLAELIEAATAAKNELASAGRYNEPVCRRLEAALGAFPAAWDDVTESSFGKGYEHGCLESSGYQFGHAELATVLAALRFYQSMDMGEPENRPTAIHDIATANDAVISLDAAGIDQLCEDLNSAAQVSPADRLATLIGAGLTFGEVLNAFGERQREREPHLMPYADAVDGVLTEGDGTFDTDNTPIVSKGDDAGAYVLVWRWVRDDEAGVEGEKSYAVWAKPNGPLTGAEPDIYDLDGALARVGAHRDLFLKAVKTEGGYEDPFFYAEEHTPEDDD